MAEIKRLCPGVAYALTQDGCGNLMAACYHKDIAAVTDHSMGFSKSGAWISVPNVPLELYDDYSSGIAPGFTLPKAKVNKKVHPKTTIKNPTMTIGHWQVNDYYTLGRFPPNTT